MASPSGKFTILVPERHGGVGECLADCETDWLVLPESGHHRRDQGSRTLIADGSCLERIPDLAAAAEVRD